MGLSGGTHVCTQFKSNQGLRPPYEFVLHLVEFKTIPINCQVEAKALVKRLGLINDLDGGWVRIALENFIRFMHSTFSEKDLVCDQP